MAIFLLGKTTCSICETVITAGEDVVMTTHFIADERHVLWHYSDSTMHRQCFSAWEHRSLFIRTFNETYGAKTWGNGTYRQMQENGDIQTRSRSQQSA